MAIAMKEIHETSNNVHSIGYDPETQELSVRFLKWGKPEKQGDQRPKFPGALYIYSAVPPSEFAELDGLADRNMALLAAGKGAERSFTGFFNERIIGDRRAPFFKYRKVDES